MNTSRSLIVGQRDGQWFREVVERPIDDLVDGDVLVEVDYSCINYKDGLAGSATGKVARLDPLVPGIDLAGTVVASASSEVAVGDQVIAHGYDIGVAHHGGFSTHARVRAEWVVPMPKGLDARSAMLVGTAGYTSAMSVVALERAGLRPGDGPVLVTGATGGVGSMAIGMLAALGHEVVASSGKPEAAEWLRSLGAAEVLDRSVTSAPQERPLEKERWAGAVDCVGGPTLAYVVRTLRYGASVAASGLTGGSGLQTTVLPFILRGVNLLGIDSVQTPLTTRRQVWSRIATDLRPRWLDDTNLFGTEVVGLEGVPEQMDRVLAGAMRGRVLVDPRC